MYIEQFSGETDEQLNQFIRSTLVEIYGAIPERLEYSLGEFCHTRGAAFRHFKCVAGSVSAWFMLRASHAPGLGRRLLLIGEKLNGDPFVTLCSSDGEENLAADEVMP